VKEVAIGGGEREGNRGEKEMGADRHNNAIAAA